MMTVLLLISVDFAAKSTWTAPSKIIDIINYQIFNTATFPQPEPDQQLQPRLPVLRLAAEDGRQRGEASQPEPLRAQPCRVPRGLQVTLLHHIISSLALCVVDWVVKVRL